jgi:fucose permease
MPRSLSDRRRIAVAFLGLAVIGISSGGSGVLLPYLISYYGLGKGGTGPLFVSFTVGYVLAASGGGPLAHRFGVRACYTAGGLIMALAAAGQSLRPQFVVFVALQLALGLGVGTLDAGLSAFLSMMERPTPLLNLLHACFGAGATVGPALATAMISTWRLPWNSFLLLFTLVCLPVVVGLVAWYPRGVSFPAVSTIEPVRGVGTDPSPKPVEPSAGQAGQGPEGTARLLRAVAGLRVVWLGSVFLAAYVGLEVGLGSWGFTFLRESRSESTQAAGVAMAGYWLGLTLGRLVLARAVERLGLGPRGLNAVGLIGVAASTAAVWLVPSPLVATAGFAVIGFFLGPLFPTMLAVVPSLAPVRLVVTAVGVLVGFSAVGGAAAPWYAGVLAQSYGSWSLLPFALLLTAVLGVVWWWLAQGISHARSSRGPAAQPRDPVRPAPDPA